MPIRQQLIGMIRGACHLKTLLVLLSWMSKVDARDAVVATGNPHIPKAGHYEDSTEHCGPCYCQAQQLLVSATTAMPPLTVQPGSLVRAEKRKVSGAEVTIYHVKQPAELSPKQLPFKVLPLRRIDLEDVVEVQVEPHMAMNSWFVGYAWSILACTRCEGTHIGWKFTPTTGQADAFYALIVESIDVEDRSEIPQAAERLIEGLRVVGQPLAALGIASSILRTGSS